MAVSTGYLIYITEQLSALRGLRTRRMFGGVGMYSGDVFFALVSDDILYLKVDDESRPAYEARGAKPFRPYANRPEVSLTYFEAPADVLEDQEALLRWARRSIAAAERAAAGQSTRVQRARPARREAHPRRSRRG